MRNASLPEPQSSTSSSSSRGTALNYRQKNQTHPSSSTRFFLFCFYFSFYDLCFSVVAAQPYLHFSLMPTHIHQQAHPHCSPSLTLSEQRWLLYGSACLEQFSLLSEERLYLENISVLRGDLSSSFSVCLLEQKIVVLFAWI